MVVVHMGMAFPFFSTAIYDYLCDFPLSSIDIKLLDKVYLI